MTYSIDIIDLYRRFTLSSGVSIDTRRIQQNAIYFAIRGERFNGNQFAEQALNLGASTVVVDEEIGIADHRVFMVPDSLAALQQLAHYHRQHLSATIIAITGSNGKTTTKELLYSIFSLQYNSFATPGNFNNHIGLPLSLLSIKKDVEYAILEMGDNQVGDIQLLCKIAEPNAGLITNLGLDHIGNYTSVNENYQSKIELFDYISTNNAAFFCNEKDEVLSELVYDNIVRYGSIHSIASAEVLVSSPSGLTIQLSSNRMSEPVLVESSLSGQYNVENIVAAAAVSLFYEVPIDKICAGIEAYYPKNNRSQYLQIGRLSVILDAYNANPSSVSLALKSFSELKGKKAVILGDMLELGQYSVSEHQKIGQLVAEFKIDCFIGIGSEMKAAVDEAQSHIPTYHYLSAFDCLPHLASHFATIDLLLVKGSRALKLETILDWLQGNIGQ